MLKIAKLFILLLFSTAAHTLVAQSTWLWAESIDRTSVWNEPYYKPLNSADNLVTYRGDSANFCTDCSLSNTLWKGIESSSITIWQLSKKSILVPQKISTIKTQLLNQIAKTPSIATIKEALKHSEITIYRKPLTESVLTINALVIEWIALQIPFEKDTTIFYLKAAQCLPYLKAHSCNWVLPSNHHTLLNMADALIQRKYATSPTINIVASTNLQVPTSLKKNPPILFQTLQKNNHQPISLTNTDSLYIRLQVMYSARTTSTYNRGLHKIHIVDYLLKLHAENNIMAYSYHPEGYFTKISQKEINAHLLVETIEDEEYVARRYSKEDFTCIHVLKTFTKISKEGRIRPDWFIIGMDASLSTNIHNTHAVSFKYDDVMEALRSANMMWYSGTNEKDSMLLNVALQKDYIDYDALVILNLYGDTITSIHKAPIWIEQKNEHEPLSILYAYGSALIKSFRENSPKISVSKNKNAINTYQLTYHFTSKNDTLPAKNVTLIEALIDAIQQKKLNVYMNQTIQHKTTSESVLNKLDKARFYKTGNAKKDSIYISKIPLEKRYIKPSTLSDFELTSIFKSSAKKSINTGLSFGVFIPAELNPQYEPDTLCYVSYGEFLSFLQKNKVYKKLSVQFESLLNQHSIILVTNFYDLLVYDASNENADVWSDLPEYVRERCVLQPKPAE
jgi:hypothetical protein